MCVYIYIYIYIYAYTHTHTLQTLDRARPSVSTIQARAPDTPFGGGIYVYIHM